MDDRKAPYGIFVRDSWGIARRTGALMLTPSEYQAQQDLRRQRQVGWLVPAEDAERQR